MFIKDLRHMSRVIGKNQSKPVNKFIYQMMYGLTVSKSIRLSNIARALSEPTDLLYTEKRLHRNLYNEKLNVEALKDNYLNFVKKKINKRNFVIGLDLVDINKEYATKMENLSGIYDSSKKKTALGYMMIQIEALSRTVKIKRNFPLSLRLYSHIESPYVSDNSRILEEVKAISKYLPKYTWVFDRGFDRKNIIEELDNLSLTYVIRQVGLRNVLYRNKKHTTKNLTRKTNLKHSLYISYISKRTGKIRYIKIKFSVLKIKLFGERKTLDGYKTILVVKMPNRPVMGLLTNKLTRTPKEAGNLIKDYGLRWGCEESTRFLKSKENGFNIEDIRVLKYEGLKRMMMFVMFAYGFLCILHDSKRKDIEKVISQNTKNFKTLPRFFFYRTIETTSKVMRNK